MKLRWSQQARINLREILTYIAAENPGAARRMNALINASTARLKVFPYLGHVSPMQGAREFLAHPSYRLFYEVSDREVIVLAIIHTSRQWPPEIDNA